MAISKKEARELAEELIHSWNDQYEYSLVYEDEEITENYPDEEDWEAIYIEMIAARVQVTWGEEA